MKTTPTTAADQAALTRALLRNGVAALGATMVAGLIIGVGGTAAAIEDSAYAKREDNATEWVVSADDDDSDDDTVGTTTGLNTDTGAGTTTGPDTATDTGLNSDDGTGSRVTGVSEDRDESADDLTKDWTLDGGDRTRDFSQNLTNDASANDTR